MAKIGYCEHASRDTLETLIKSAEWTYGMVEDVDAIALKWFKDLSEKRALSDWPKGRLFSKSAELRWRQGRYGLQVVYVTDEDALPSEVCGEGALIRAVDENGKETEDREVALWGKRKDDVWLEGRIPRLLQYPVKGAEGTRVDGTRAKIVLRTYRLEGKEGELYRFVDVVSEKGGA